jgi:hypothetical protein
LVRRYKANVAQRLSTSTSIAGKKRTRRRLLKATELCTALRGMATSRAHVLTSHAAWTVLQKCVPARSVSILVCALPRRYPIAQGLWTQVRKVVDAVLASEFDACAHDTIALPCQARLADAACVTAGCPTGTQHVGRRGPRAGLLCELLPLDLAARYTLTQTPPAQQTLLRACAPQGSALTESPSPSLTKLKPYTPQALDPRSARRTRCSSTTVTPPSLP